MAKTYTKIPGVGTGRGSLQPAVRNRLYQGPDHLLIVQSTGYTEEYKRIFYRDVRYVEVRRNRAQIWHGIISGLLFLVVLACFNLASAPILVEVIFCTPFLIWFVVNLLLGPSCDCYINTHVQTLKIPAPRRVKKVPKLIAFLRPRAEDSVSAAG